MNHHEWKLWQRTRELSAECARVSRQLSAGHHQLAAQLHRAGLAVFLAVCEGSGRYGTRELAYKLSVANGELHEVEGCLLHIKDTEALPPAALQKAVELQEEVARMLNAALPKLRIRARAEVNPR